MATGLLTALILPAPVAPYLQQHYSIQQTNGIGGSLPMGSTDHNWKISIDSITGLYTPAVVMNAPGVYYTSVWPDCNWISHDSAGMHLGTKDFYYKLEFYLPCYNSCGTSFSDSGTYCFGHGFLC